MASNCSSVSLTDGGNCFGWRAGPTGAYRWLTYSQVLERARDFGSGLIAMGLRPGTNTLVGIYSRCVPNYHDLVKHCQHLS